MLRVVDAHHHLWDLAQGNYPWLQQDYDAGKCFLGDYRPLCQDFLPADYRAASQHDSFRVVATVHVEAERNRAEQLDETRWLHQQHASHGMPDIVVAHAWLDRPDTEACLREQMRYPLLRGIRSKPVTASAPGRRVVDETGSLSGSMQDPAWLRGLSLLADLGLSWDLRVPYWHLAEAAEVAAMFPRLAIVLNHHGFAWDRSAAGLQHWRSGMEKLARQPNVHVKLSEFGLRDQPWIEADNRVIVHDTLAIFGWQRCMFASNFPVAGLRIGYPELVAAMMRMLEQLEPGQRQAVMADNALRFYRHPGTASPGF